jgi:ribonuclease ZC3H12
VDSSRREQYIQYFLSLNFNRDRIEAVIDSMGAWAETDDILKRLNSLHITAPRPVMTLNVSRNYTTNGEPVLNSNAALRPIVIDGSNIAMRHGNGRVFSCRGIQIAVDWFHLRGHKEITVFVPQWRRETPRAEYLITEQEILNRLEREGVLSFTPSRRIGKKSIVCYDDRFIVGLATDTNGVIVSNDNFRDLAEENEKWRKTIEQRLLMFTFANDIFMVPEDPLGKHGPRLSQLLQIEPAKSSKGGAQPDHVGPAVCPYGDRCTFGRRCRFAHPEREGRLGPGVLTSRSPNTSPAPSDRRHTDTAGDVVQKDCVGGHASERVSPPTGQPTHSTQRPRTSPTFPSQGDLGYSQPTGQPLPHGFSQPQSRQPPSFSSQPLSSEAHYSHSQPRPSLRDYPGQQQAPQYLGIPGGGHGNSLSPPPPPPHSSGLQASPLHSTSSAAVAGVSYAASRQTFPIANLSLGGRPRNMTDRIQNGPVATGSEDFLPMAPNVHPIIPPHHHQHGMEPGLVPRGDYPPHVPAAQYQGPPEVYNQWGSSANSYHPAYNMQQPASGYQPQTGYPHHYMPGSDSHAHPQHHRLHHSPGRNGHPADYTTTPHGGHLPPPTNVYHSRPPPTEGGPYLQDRGMFHQGPPDYRIPHHRGPESHGSGGAPRASSMYGDMGMRLHHDKVAMADKFQSSQSSPELYRDARQQPQQQPQPPAGGASTVNWTLFREVQVRLPGQEEQIMKTMLRNPHADLERIVELVQHPW